MTARSVGLAVGHATGVYRDVAAAVECAAHEIGIDPLRVTDRSTARAADVVLAVGYPRFYPWLARSLPSTRRIAWLGEPLPPADDRAVARLLRSLPIGRIIDGMAATGRLAGRGRPSIRLTDWRERAAFDHDRRVNLAAHRRAARDGIRLVVTAADRAAALRRVGVEAAVVPFGYHAVLAGPPQPVDDGDRDIDVLVLATAASDLPTRRPRLLAEVVRNLGPRIRVEVVERGAWGEERHRLLGRARVVLNIHRVPGNFTGIRNVLVGAAGAVLVSEPVDTPAPFVPGLHYIEARAEDLASAIRTILADRPRRLEMALTTQRFLLEELTMARSLEAVLQACP